MDERLKKIALDSLDELMPEIEAARNGIRPKPIVPSLESIVRGFGPESEYRRNKIYLGTAEDDMPVSINLKNVNSGPRLVVADKLAGKTGFLKNIAKTIQLTHSPKDLQFVVITPNPNEWDIPEDSPHCFSGVIPAYENAAGSMIRTLWSWSFENTSKKSFVLLFDDITRFLNFDMEEEDAMKQILQYGTQGRLFPIFTLNPTNFQKVSPWLSCFRSRIFGKISDPKEAARLISADKLKTANLDKLHPGSQFSIHNSKTWMRFSIP